MARIVALYAIDSAYGDGAAVRYARLSMLTTSPSLVTLLCWAIEAGWVLSVLGSSSRRRLMGAVMAWSSWFAIQCMRAL